MARTRGRSPLTPIIDQYGMGGAVRRTRRLLPPWLLRQP